MGPVQEKETIARVSAMKKMPPIVPMTGFRIHRIGDAAGQRDLEEPKKGQRKDQEDCSEEEIEPDIGRDIVQDIRILCFQEIERDADQDVDHKNKEAIKGGVGDRFTPRAGLFGKERNRQRDHREGTGHDQTDKTAQHTKEEDGIQALWSLSVPVPPQLFTGLARSMLVFRRFSASPADC